MSSSPLVGNWNFTISEYENSDCTGSTEVYDGGTMVFSEDGTGSVVSSESFEDWCDGTITDGVCNEGGGTYELADFESDCEDDGGSFSNGNCDYSATISNWSFSEPILITTITNSMILPDYYSDICAYVGGTYSNGVCTITEVDTINVSLDGNTMSWNDSEEADEYYDAYCELFVATKQ